MSDPTPGSLEDWAARRPDAAAIIEDDQTLTFAQWNQAADAVAEGLIRRGVGPDDIIVTRLHIRTEWPVIASAAAKIGCSILGLNWRLTPSEVNYVLSNSGATVVVCDDPDPAALRPAFDGLTLKLAVSVDQPAEGFLPYAELLAAPPVARQSRGDAPLIIYTSGTTGLPKGVPTAGSGADPTELLEYARSVAESRPQVEGDVVLVTMPMHHGAGPGLVRQTLRAGNLMVLLRRFDPVAVLETIARHRISFWTGVPTMYKRLAGLPPEVFARHSVASIRTLGVGAAPVPPDLKDWIVDHFGPCLNEAYGSTEVGLATYLTPEMQARKPGSSGVPHRHVHLRIRDPDGHDLPPGETGEIWIKTPVTIHNYLNADRLGEDTIDADGFFRTGDVGRLDADGFLFITDRAKDMIIAGGVNIYPAEVEAALLKHAAVQDAAVIGIPDDEFGEQVKAFVELKPGQAATAPDILSAVSGHLASYKRPRSLEIVAELPRNTMGKLLKRELRAPYWANRERKV